MTPLVYVPRQLRNLILHAHSYRILCPAVLSSVLVSVSAALAVSLATSPAVRGDGSGARIYEFLHLVPHVELAF
ncbi:hypothetical protein M6B38_307420 [Iris pallida]|uniref:Uncharacterized protein n=1 Tax=Iris pallida TaxID=29817 RepID=A0AAX6EAD5_IRIPA|nr:hypothetical protein M6B38_199470 [Iris pallida]KAJ6841122.1 hypothetical protein M6B38_307420 [Iris pallida]